MRIQRKMFRESLESFKYCNNTIILNTLEIKKTVAVVYFFIIFFFRDAVFKVFYFK